MRTRTGPRGVIDARQPRIWHASLGDFRFRATRRSKRLNYSAVSRSASSTLANYALEFNLKRCQPRDAALDLLKLMPSDAVGSLAGLLGVVR